MNDEPNRCGLCRRVIYSWARFNIVTGVTAYECCRDCWNAYTHLVAHAAINATSFVRLFPDREHVR